MPGSSNFLQFNGPKNNQEGDAAYSADTMRASGAATSAIVASPLFNKVLYQTSTFVSALAQALANKGYAVSDSDYSALVSVLANVRAASDFLTSIITVAYATSVNFPANTSAQFDLTLTGNVSSSTLTGHVAGQLLLFIVSQDGVGNRTFSWPTNINVPGRICPFANSTSIQMFVVRADGVTVDPITSMQWVTASGLILAPNNSVVAINSTGTVSSAFPEIFEKVDASGGPVTRTLYVANPGLAGFKVNGKKIDTTAAALTYAGGGGQTIDGFPNFQILRPYDALTFICDGANWFIY